MSLSLEKTIVKVFEYSFRKPTSFITLLSVLLGNFSRRDFVMFNRLMRDFTSGSTVENPFNRQNMKYIAVLTC